MATGERQIWGLVTPQLPAAFLAAYAKQLEDRGVAGVFAPQLYGPPFLPLAAAATSTTTLGLATGIALAFARSPFETAMAAMDLDRLSGGRFVLGIGASTRAWSGGFFGMPYGKPLAHLREVVEAVRLVVANAHLGGLSGYAGEYVNLDFGELQATPAPVRTEIPIWVAALRAPLVRLAAEIGDGVIDHPLWSIPWATEQVPRWIDEGAARSGRTRDDVHVNLWVWAAPGEDDAAVLDDIRPTIAFYGGMSQYEDYFAWHGFGDVAKRLQAGVQRGDYESVAAEVPDEMVRTFVLTGSPDACRSRLEAVWDVADSVTLAPPVYGLAPERQLAHLNAVAETFYRPLG